MQQANQSTMQNTTNYDFAIEKLVKFKQFIGEISQNIDNANVKKYINRLQNADNDLILLKFKSELKKTTDIVVFFDLLRTKLGLQDVPITEEQKKKFILYMELFKEILN